MSENDVSGPMFLRRLSTDEYNAPAHQPVDKRAIARSEQTVEDKSDLVGISRQRYRASRLGTAAGLRALNAEWGENFYAVPEEATVDIEAAQATLGGPQTIVDIQTHYAVHRAPTHYFEERVKSVYKALAPGWWTGISEIEHYSMAEYLRCVFLETDTSVAVLSSGPGLDDWRMLFNGEMAGTRAMLERLGASGRLLNHCVVHANLDYEIDSMPDWLERHRPAGWKVYTPGILREFHTWENGSAWWLDDERGLKFLEQVRQVGPRLVCAHKGISGVPYASPRDVGPAAAAFPDLTFVIYHSGFEPITVASEGPWTPETADVGVNRLVTSVREANIKPGSNVYAELGTTWFCLIRRPVEAAHVLGKLLLALGEDNVIWASDGIWYGPAQPSIDALRVFQIPERMQEEYGYPALTPEIKAKLLGLNAARVYGIDVEGAKTRFETDDLAWTRAALDELSQ